MPVMQIATTAIDQTSLEYEKIVGNLQRFAETDAICHPAQSPQKLVRLQKKYWTPLLEWIDCEHGIHLESTTQLLLKQPVESVDKVMRLVRTMDPWRVAAFDAMVTTSKSMVIALALYFDRIGVDRAFKAARLEEDFQISEWGRVEGAFGHTIDIEWVRIQLAAAKSVQVMLDLDQVSTQPPDHVLAGDVPSAAETRAQRKTFA
eukprot:TRINITY_DN44340_c0_g1_i1.p1 TRINITY_DN44340_c0_g1~~TRINITY_DN44340_c0_g1_i1.p1  ORF type:complete len:204 (-),score=104.50 TRINITY_DN44340_c0_g1_i1:116-727(-)